MKHTTERLTHVQAARNTGTLQWLLSSILPASSHQTRHLILSELNLAATKGGETDVSDLELVGGSRHGCGCCEVRRVCLKGVAEGRERREGERESVGGRMEVKRGGGGGKVSVLSPAVLRLSGPRVRHLLALRFGGVAGL
jgi:hypothetical protein